MRIAILSDSHDNIWNLDRALAAVNEAGCDALLHCGDLVAPFIVAQIAQAFAGPVHIVEGNNDGDGRLQQQVAAGFNQVTLHGPYIELDLGGRRIASSIFQNRRGALHRAASSTWSATAMTISRIRKALATVFWSIPAR